MKRNEIIRKDLFGNKLSESICIKLMKEAETAAEQTAAGMLKLKVTSCFQKQIQRYSYVKICRGIAYQAVSGLDLCNCIITTTCEVMQVFSNFGGRVIGNGYTAAIRQSKSESAKLLKLMKGE